ncbi:MAG: hypothetical protein JSV27_05755 [Candidatus Bathyarchaeota archaeon]|nr:MAG: hypothetical protein JSV27_05755 [Candidatus Bathyarchaeota archaeon]
MGNFIIPTWVEFPMVMKIDEDEIRGLISDGWNFRAKTVKGHRYITRRKGQTERGVGPYDPELWKLITNLREQAKTEKNSLTVREYDEVTRTRHSEEWLRKRNELMTQLDYSLSINRGSTMMTSCHHRDREGHCIYWTWKEKPGFFKIVDDLDMNYLYVKKKISSKGVMTEKWVFSASPWFCSNCTVYPIRS